jgi:class 3 adenylate cyclase/tetratricopeptide (TPR) repeat protein
MQAGDRASSARLSAYVPAYIQRRIAGATDPFDKPRCAPLEVAVLFADISGFTDLTARYERQGRLGIENLTEVLNDYFARTIGEVLACGGDIESIAGDGLAAFWEVRPDRDLARCVTFAGECGRRLHAVARSILSDGAPLRLRAALVCGSALAIEVGGTEHRRHFLLSGAPLFEITETLGRANPGETALSPAAQALLGTDPAAVPIEPPPRPVAAPEHLPALMRFVPQQVTRLAQPGGAELFAEFRRLSSCFLRLTGLVCDSPQDLERVQQAIGLADAIVNRYGGGEQRLTMNDKGALLMVVFGLPGSAHEDDPVRAVLAMRELLTALDDLWLDCTCGVATGIAYCGPIGGEERQIYTVIGSSVNLAASLSDIRGHRIVCDAETARAAAHRIAFEPLPGAAGKGLSADTRLYRPSTRRARGGAAPDIVGRGGELNELLSLVDRRIADGSGALALVEGEAGIGKSTLLRGVTKQAVVQGFQVLAGAADAFERSTPFRAWREPFAALLGLEPGADSAAALHAVAAWAGQFPDIAPLAPLLGNVLAVSLPDTDLTRHMEGAVRAENTLAAMQRTLADAAARKPTLLILDDVQWLDPSSLDLLERLDVKSLGMVVALAARSGGVEGDGGEFEAFASQPDVRRIHIQGMDDEAIGTLIARRIGALSVPQQVVDFVRERAAGNPYYSEEVAAILLDAGQLAVTDGQCTIRGSLEDLSMDGSLESVIASRVDLLTPPEQYTVKVASVQGRRVAYDMLSGVRRLNPEEPPLPAQIAELTRREILLPLEDEPTWQFLFKHLITQQAIYNRLLFSQRRELHRAVAEWMEEHLAGEVDSHLAVIGMHWSLAERHDKATTYFERAGERSLHSGAARETIDLLERALDSLGKVAGPRDPLREARILRQLGDAHSRRGALLEGVRWLTEALRRLGEPWPKTKAGIGRRLLVEALRQVWRRTLHLRPTAGSERDTERAYIYHHLTSINYFLNRPADMILATNCAVNAGERSTDKLRLTEAYMGFANVTGILGLHGFARNYSRLALACLPAGLSAAQRILPNELRTIYISSIGELAEAEALVTEMAEASREIGDERHLREATSLLGIITLLRGDAERSHSYRDAFFDMAMQANDTQTQCWAWIERGEHALYRGDAESAIAGFTAATSLLGTVSSTERVWIAGQLAQAQLMSGDSAAARETATGGLARLTAEPPTGFYVLEGCAGLADVFLELGDRPMAARAVKRLGAFARSFPLARPRHLLAQGRLQALNGNRSAAEKLMQKALDEARHLALPRDIALAERHLGRLAGDARRAAPT